MDNSINLVANSVLLPIFVPKVIKTNNTFAEWRVTFQRDASSSLFFEELKTQSYSTFQHRCSQNCSLTLKIHTWVVAHTPLHGCFIAGSMGRIEPSDIHTILC